MKNAIGLRTVVGGGIVLALIWLGFSVFQGSRAKVVSEAPKTISETRYFKDVSPYFYTQMPFLKKGFQFIDSSNSLESQEGAESSLLVQRASKEGVSESLPDAPPILTTKDFAPYINVIKTEKEALTYVMFLSRKGYPWMEPIRFNYFQDIPFIGIEFVNISSATIVENSIRGPRVSVVGGKKAKNKFFSIVRTVIPLDQPNLNEDKILSGADFLQLTELAEVTEKVTENGTYSFTLRRFPVKNCPIGNPLKAIRQVKK